MKRLEAKIPLYFNCLYNTDMLTNVTYIRPVYKIQIMESQKELFQQAKSLMKGSNPMMDSMLYYNICFLKMGGKYVYSTTRDVEELVDFINLNID